MCTVLCIDDNSYILEMYERILHSKGYKVITAANGAKGLTLAREHSIDIVVLDFHMPGLDGVQVARILAAEQPHVPVLVCSGSPDDLPQCVYLFTDAVLSDVQRFERIEAVDPLNRSRIHMTRPVDEKAATERAIWTALQLGKDLEVVGSPKPAASLW